MPYEVEPSEHCEDCKFGYCTSWVDARRPDRDTDFRFHREIAKQCTFEDFLPGTENDPNPPDTEYEVYIDQMVENAKAAGQYLFENGHFDDEVIETKEEHSFSASGVGVVAGDTYEMLVRATFWNCCADWNQYVTSGDWTLYRDKPDYDFDSEVCIITLRDNYNLRNLFDEDFLSAYDAVIDAMEEQGAELTFSTPDAVAIRLDNVSEDDRRVFRDNLTHVDRETIELLKNGREYVEGQLWPNDIAAAIGIKTSGRADRNQQFAMEANGWLTLFRSIFGVESQRYYMTQRDEYGADSSRATRAAWLPSIEGTEDGLQAEPVIEAEVPITTPQHAEERFYDTFLPVLVETADDDLNTYFFDSLGVEITKQSDVEGWEE